MTTEQSAETTKPAAQPASRSGIRTTELWFGLAAALLTALYASGVIPVEGTWAKIAAIAATMLTALGYTVSRTLVKKALMLVVLLFALGSTQMACHPDVKPTINVIEDCISQERPQIESLIVKWLTNPPSLQEIKAEAISAGIHIGGCAIHEWAQILLTPAPGNKALPREEGFAINELIIAYEKEAKVAPNVVFKTPKGNL